jgi:hypothetical protein
MLVSRFRNSLHLYIELRANFGIEGHQQAIESQCRFGFEVRMETDIDDGANFD